MNIKRLLTTIASFVLLSSVAMAQTYTFGVIPWTLSSQGDWGSDGLGRIYPVNFYIGLTDSDGQTIRMSETPKYGNWDSPSTSDADNMVHGTALGKTFAFQVNEASGTYEYGLEGPAVITVPIPVAGFDTLTIQHFVCNALTPTATAASASTDLIGASHVVGPDGTTYPAYYYRMVGPASCELQVRGTLFPETDHILHGLTPAAHAAWIAYATWRSSMMMSPIPDETWINGRYANQAQILSSTYGITTFPGVSQYMTAQMVQPATYPIKYLGVHHFPVGGLRAIDIMVSGNSATQCIMARLNRRLITDTGGNVKYP